MIAPTTQEPLINSNESTASSRRRFFRTMSRVKSEKFNDYIQQHYGAMWGTLKFESTLSDYSNEVIPFICFDQVVTLHSFRYDHFSTLMIILIYMHYGNL